MKRSLILLCALIGPVSGSAQSRVGPYVDPALQSLTQVSVRQAIERAPRLGEGAPAEVQTMAGRVALKRASLTERPRVSAFVQVRDARGVDELRTLGAIIGSERNGIVTADIPIDAISRLSSTIEIVSVESAHTIIVTHDSSARAIRLNEVRSVTSGGLWTGATGRNVIAAIYDTGIDFTHQDFRDPGGATRLLALWDQTRTGTAPTGFSFGNLCTRENIQAVIENPSLAAAQCSEQDTNGHGTHTAGSVAGDGSGGTGGTPFQYAGVAPNADIIVVKGGNGSFSETNILDGLRWLEAESRRRNRPMVVNMSLGGQTGAHDGSRIYEKGIDDLSRPGFIVVISSGNEGSNANVRNRDGTAFTSVPVFIHGTGTVVTGQTREFVFDVPTFAAIAPTCNEAVGFSLWYKAPDRLRIQVVRPDGSTHTADTGENTAQDRTPGGNISINNGASGVNPQNGDFEATVQANDCGASGAAPMPGTYRLRVTPIGNGSGQSFHFWMIQNFLGGGAIARGGSGFDNRYIVGSPGNAKTAITVGAFATRMCWPSTAATTPAGVCFTQVEEIGDIARFSSGGPTRDGRLKPEITAPGMATVSALSRNSVVAANRITPDGAHLANQGTSMAAPQVTGTIALLLEARPTLTADEVRDIFSRSATRDAFTIRTYSTEPGTNATDWWGYGKLNVPRALCETGTSGLTQLVTITPESDTLPQNATLQVESCVVGPSPVVYTSTNPAVASVSATGLIRGLQPGSALIIARAGNVADTVSVTVVAPAAISALGLSAAPFTTTLGTAGAVLPLLSLQLKNPGVENIRIEQLVFTLTGRDAGAKVVVVEDRNRNGKFEASDRVIAAQLRGTGDTVSVATTGLTLLRHDSLSLLVTVELSGAAPNNSSFQMRFLPDRTRTVGERSGARDLVLPVPTPIVSAAALTTVLIDNEFFSMSENPVRTGRVVFNFKEAPTAAGIYTLTGRRVRDLTALLDDTGAVEWDLKNDEGARVAPGVYLVVFNVGAQQVREKLFVMPRNQGSAP